MGIKQGIKHWGNRVSTLKGVGVHQVITHFVFQAFPGKRTAINNEAVRFT
jgi:hypothetical protein